MPSCTLLIGNNYHRIPNRKALRDRTGSYLKVHDWTVYVDVQVYNSCRAQELECAIDRVTFDLGSTFEGNPFVCSAPVPVFRDSEITAWRFKTRQAAYGSVTAQITVRGAGGKIEKFLHPITFNNNNSIELTFEEARSGRPLKILPMPPVSFGIELECTTSLELEDIQGAIPLKCDLIRNYSQGQHPSSYWKLVPDSSIACNRSNPDCNTFEIVSPILFGGDGLALINKVCSALKYKGIQVNKSAGFHVHINVKGYTLGQLIKICQQFIKYEDVFDSFMPPSRRTGSAESDKFFKSNRQSVGKFLTNKQRNDVLAQCDSLEDLAQLMNSPGDERYYKLNLQNLVTGRQPTIEFRQHSATVNYDKISAWVRFCAQFCSNAAKLRAPTPAQIGNSSSDDMFDNLFWYVIKDRASRDFFRQRTLRLDRELDACCSGCARGGACSAEKGNVQHFSGLCIQMPAGSN